ncbi:MAG: ABC transporter permease [Gemmatimonadales bacterium]
MNKLWAIIRREFITKVQTRAFVIGTVLGPVLMIGLIVLPVVLGGRGRKVNRIVIVDAGAGTLGPRLEDAMRLAHFGNDTSDHRYIVQRVLAAGRVDEVRDSLVALTGLNGPSSIDGVLVATDSAITTGRIVYLGANAGSLGDVNRLETVLDQALLAERLESRGIDPEVVKAADIPIRLQALKVSEGKLTGQSGEASFVLSYAMAMILYIALLLYGIQVMSSVLEEKNSRIMEVLVSSVSPFQLMLGKVVGVGAVGLFQLGIWVGTALFLSANLVPIAGLFNVPPEAVSTTSVPVIGVGLLVVFLAFFLVGFFLYAAAYAAVGAMCNSLQEAQQSAIIVNLGIVASLFAAISILPGDPNGSLPVVLSYIPFTSPLVMPVRYSINTLPVVSVVVSLAVTTGGMLLVAWIASRIYRVGILMYGKKPSLKELVHWVRA